VFLIYESKITAASRGFPATARLSRFEILTLKARKLLNFLTPPFFEAPFGGNPLEFGDEIWRQKTRVLGLLDGEEIMTLAFFVLTQYRRVTDGQTDGRTRYHDYYPC